MAKISFLSVALCRQKVLRTDGTLSGNDLTTMAKISFFVCCPLSPGCLAYRQDRLGKPLMHIVQRHDALRRDGCQA